MAASGLGYRMSLVGTGWVNSLLLTWLLLGLVRECPCLELDGVFLSLFTNGLE